MPSVRALGCRGATRAAERTEEDAEQVVSALRLPGRASPAPGPATTGQWPARTGRTKANGPGKRLLDLILASAALLVTWPMLIVLGLAVKVSSAGPALFRQERIGRGMRPFTMLKLRTMVDGADRLVAGLLEESGADQRFYKFRDDPRVTGVGRWLRRWSLDELPQLWNVLRGDMSLVGPRPGLASEVEVYEGWQLARLAVRPGLTGAWQVSGRSEPSFDDCVRLDLAYIEDWSPRVDLIILAKTIPAVLRRRGSW
jgi:lipopolysaccharide/colanic/teichoic acid biosynthesis glycosyltransferase